MKIACLQFNPGLGAFEQNINHADALLASSKTSNLDLLVLPEMAFSGYNFPNLESIRPFLEPTTAGPSTEWARKTAWRLNCHVIVGYPEVNTTPDGQTKNYNSTVTVSPTGQVLANYRKSFLYYTDETWASEGPWGSAQQFSQTDVFKPFFCGPLGRLGKLGLGICMDINQYRFETAWSDFEFANAMLKENVKIVILSMAWLTDFLPHELEVEPDKPDMQTVGYWRERFYPFLAREAGADDSIVVVFANRCGVEGSMAGGKYVEVEEGDRACYAGSSCAMKFQDGGVGMFHREEGVAILGKAEEGLLVIDTAQRAQYSLTSKAT